MVAKFAYVSKRRLKGYNIERRRVMRSYRNYVLITTNNIKGKNMKSIFLQNVNADHVHKNSRDRKFVRMPLNTKHLFKVALEQPPENCEAREAFADAFDPYFRAIILRVLEAGIYVAEDISNIDNMDEKYYYQYARNGVHIYYPDSAHPFQKQYVCIGISFGSVEYLEIFTRLNDVADYYLEWLAAHRQFVDNPEDYEILGTYELQEALTEKGVFYNCPDHYSNGNYEFLVELKVPNSTLFKK